MPRDKAEPITRGAARQEVTHSHSAFPQHISAWDWACYEAAPSSICSAAPGHVNHSTGRDWDQPSAGVRWPGYLGNSTRDGNHSHGQECASTQRFTGQPSRLGASQSSLGKRRRGLRGSACLVPHCPGDRRQQGSPSGEVHGLNPNEKQRADRSSRQLQPLGSKV